MKRFLEPGNKTSVPVLISASFLIGGKNLRDKILVTAKDMSEQKKTQNIVLKAIIETEEKERMRLAKDIHDSVGQHLSAIKFYIGTSADRGGRSKTKINIAKSEFCPWWMCRQT
jgi:signal transduction histidine kinase